MNSGRAFLALVAVSIVFLSCEQESVRTLPPRLEVETFFAINGNDSVTLGWRSSVNGTAASFDIYRSADPAFTPSSATLYAALPSTVTSFVDTVVVNGALYYYRLVPMEQLPNGTLQWGSVTDAVIGKPMDYGTVTTINYSDHIQSIFNSSCAVSGCHVGTQSDNLTGVQKALLGNEQFSLKSWEDLIHGGPHGAVIVPFKASKSHLVFHVNSDTLVASVSLPHMPLPGFSLPYKQVRTLMRWINAGAADDFGAVPFTVDPEGKVFVTNQAEDLITVIDISTNLVARYIQAGVPNVFVQPPNAPHNITVDNIHGFYYVNLVAAGKVLKYRLSDNTLLGEVSGILSPTQVALSPTGDTAFVAQFASGTTAIRMFMRSVPNPPDAVAFPDPERPVTMTTRARRDAAFRAVIRAGSPSHAGRGAPRARARSPRPASAGCGSGRRPPRSSRGCAPGTPG